MRQNRAKISEILLKRQKFKHDDGDDDNNDDHDDVILHYIVDDHERDLDILLKKWGMIKIAYSLSYEKKSTKFKHNIIVAKDMNV